MYYENYGEEDRIRFVYDATVDMEVDVDAEQEKAFALANPGYAEYKAESYAYDIEYLDIEQEANGF